MNDVQREKPKHEIPIDRVGIADLRYPIKVLDRQNTYQQTVADVSMSVELPRSYRGTHMSRFVSVLEKHRGEITYKTAKLILTDMLETFCAERAHLDLTFDYFIDKKAPVTGLSSYIDVPSSFSSTLNSAGDFDFILGAEIPVQTLCPCSKEISDRGAHNQRAMIELKIRFDSFVWIEELVAIAERSASAPIYTLLKRPDEKYVTEQAYDNPRFVEDVVRNLANALKSDERITWYRAKVRSIESIHTHTAFAVITSQ